MTDRHPRTHADRFGRSLLAAVVIVMCVAAAGAYVWRRASTRGDGASAVRVSGGAPVSAAAQRRDAEPGTAAKKDRTVAEAASVQDAAASIARIRSGPHVYYRSARPDEFGKVIVAALDAPDQRRAPTPLACDRVDFGRSRGICLADARGPLGPAAEARIVTTDFAPVGSVALPGVPIRARLSPDERYAAATVFVTGERYDSDFTTRTAIIDTRTGQALGDLEQFTTLRDGQAFRRVDFNFWGVTFAADGRFFATLGTGGRRYLVAGDVRARRMDVVREAVECPSLSPDGRTIGFKSRLEGSREWRIHTWNLDARTESALASETRNIDDQVEWLDDTHLLYQFVAERGVPEEALNVWVASTTPDDPTPPAVFIRGGNSPAVVR